MDYLELTRRLAREVGASGRIQTLQGTEGEFRRLADWVNESWVELQMVRDTWKWRVGEFEVPMTVGQRVVDTSSYPDFYRVLPNQFFGKLDSATNWAVLAFVSFRDWQDLVRTRPPQEGVPVYYTERSDLVIEVDPIPSVPYSVRGLYTKRPQFLVDDFDVPSLPEEYHMAIVYKAMMLYGGYESAPEIYQSGEAGFNRIYQMLVNTDIPDVHLGTELA